MRYTGGGNVEFKYEDGVDPLNYAVQIAKLYAKIDRSEAKGMATKEVVVYATYYKDLVGRAQLSYLRARITRIDLDGVERIRRYYWQTNHTSTGGGWQQG